MIKDSLRKLRNIIFGENIDKNIDSSSTKVAIEVRNLPERYEYVAHISLVEDIVVLAKVQTNFGIQYATWASSDGENWYHGHYTFDYEEAMKDMFDRAERYAHIHRPTAYEAWMAEEVDERIKEWIRYSYDGDKSSEELLNDTEFMYNAENAVRDSHEYISHLLGNLIEGNIAKAYRDTFCMEETDKHCPRCGEQLKTSDLYEYKYMCENCEENFYEIEIE